MISSTLTRLICFMLLATAFTAAAMVKRETNAYRLARNLPPLPPRRLYQGSKSDTARKSRRSAVPNAFTCPGTEQPYCCDPSATNSSDCDATTTCDLSVNQGKCCAGPGIAITTCTNGTPTS